MIAGLVALAVLLAAAAAWQLAAERGEDGAAWARAGVWRITGGRIQGIAQAALALGIHERVQRAGLAGRLAPPAVVAAKGAGCLAGVGVAALVGPVLPGRLGMGFTPLMATAGFLAPDALLERAARLRRARLVAALPDALDVLAVGVGAGRTPAGVMVELAGHGGGPLAGELAVTVTDVSVGRSQRDAVAALSDRVGGAEVAALAAAVERSRRYGSPLADQLHAQAEALRADARRRTQEAASRAAPKIQLVVALILVPSVLLMILAAIVAHSDALLGSL